MDTQNENREMLSPYVSVDCVLLGINDDKLTVLLAERKSEEGELIGYKLPGSLIYENEDLDDAAYRILNDSTGLKRVQLKQFRCFGSPARTSNRLDVMCCLPNVTIMGDKTGGGSGMPFTSELPNGWTVRFSASPHFNADMEQIEWGIEPDIKVNMDETDETKHIDTIIEKARAFLKGEWTPAVSE